MKKILGIVLTTGKDGVLLNVGEDPIVNNQAVRVLPGSITPRLDDVVEWGFNGSFYIRGIPVKVISNG